MDAKRIRRRRALRILLLFVLSTLVYIFLLRSSTDQGALYVTAAIDVALLPLALVLSLGLASQFVLPVNSSPERSAAFVRLLNYLAGERGPVMFVRDGAPVETLGERMRSGQGVLLTDHHSAAVLRTDARFTRAVGPGSVVFTRRGERLAEAFDLRRQMRSIKGQPATAGAKAETFTSMAVTRDGIPISADLLIKFMLRRAGQHKRTAIADIPPYRVSQDAIQQAVYGRIHDDHGDMSWTELPMRLLVELWREYVKEKPLEDFLEGGIEAIENMRTKMLARLTRERSQEGGSESDLANPEFRILDRRGVRILEVDIINIYLPEDIQEERLRAWLQDWAGPAERELYEAEEYARQESTKARMDASVAILEGIVRKTAQQMQWDRSINQRDTILLVLEGLNEFCNRDPALQPLSLQIRHVMDQVRSRDTNCRDPEAS
jgi:hypothetical protein